MTSRPPLHPERPTLAAKNGGYAVTNNNDQEFASDDDSDDDTGPVSQSGHELGKHEIDSKCQNRTPQRPPKLPVHHTSTSPKTVAPSSPKRRGATSSPEGRTFESDTSAYGPTETYMGMMKIIGVLALIAAVVYGYHGGDYWFKKTKSCTFEALQNKYPEQSPTGIWDSLAVGIESIVHKRYPSSSVYLLVHKGGSRMDTLIRDVANYTATECFAEQMSLELYQDDFSAADYGHVIETFKKKIEKGKVILVANLNNIPPESARALHTICDTHNPIAEDVVVFLTLVTDVGRGSTIQRVHDTLFHLWGSKLPRNELDPLITRVTDHIIVLKS